MTLPAEYDTPARLALALDHHPAVYATERDSCLLASALPPAPPTQPCHAGGAPADPGRRLLDLGCGEGLCALWAVGLGYQVTACDVNPHAVELTRRNARRLGLEGSLTCYHSDLFRDLPRELAPFGTICCNPPYLPADPEGMTSLPRPGETAAQAAWQARALEAGPRGDGLLRPLLEQVPDWLAGAALRSSPPVRALRAGPQAVEEGPCCRGRLLLLVSSLTRLASSLLAGWQVRTLARESGGPFEQLCVLELRP